MTLDRPRTGTESVSGRPAGSALRAAAATCLLLLLLPAIAPAQQRDLVAEAGGLALEAASGVALPSGDLAAFAEPGFSVAAAGSYLLTPNLALRVDGELDLPGRDAEPAPLLNVYAATASLEYIARQDDPGRPPLRTAVRVGGGLSLVEAAEMPAAAPAGATFSESYLTLSAGLRLGYTATRDLVVYLAPGVRWFDLPEDDASRLTEGLAAAPPASGWIVPVRLGVRLRL